MKKVTVGLMLIVAVLVITEMPCQSQGKVIYGCYGEKNGDLRVVGNLEECKNKEVPIYWNQMGPQGPPGPEPTNLNASNLTSGTVPSERVSGVYSGITGVGTLSSLNVTGDVTIGGSYRFSAPRTGYVSVYGSAFLPPGSTTTYGSSHSSGVGRYLTSGESLVAPLTLPDGVQVTDVKCNVYDNSSDYDITITLIFYDTGFSPAYIGSVSSEGAQPVVQEISISGSGFDPVNNTPVDNSSRAYALMFETDSSCGTDCRILSCFITYTQSEL